MKSLTRFAAAVNVLKSDYDKSCDLKSDATNIHRDVKSNLQWANDYAITASTQTIETDKVITESNKVYNESQTFKRKWESMFGGDTAVAP